MVESVAEPKQINLGAVRVATSNHDHEKHDGSTEGYNRRVTIPTASVRSRSSHNKNQSPTQYNTRESSIEKLYGHTDNVTTKKRGQSIDKAAVYRSGDSSDDNYERDSALSFDCGPTIHQANYETAQAPL